MVIRTHLTHKLAVDQHREGLVSLADEHGGAEIREHPHEYQQGTGKHGGHDQGNDDLYDTLERCTSQAFRGFIQGIVQVF